jgi:hypothetical protein
MVRGGVERVGMAARCRWGWRGGLDALQSDEHAQTICGSSITSAPPHLSATFPYTRNYNRLYPSTTHQSQ